VPVHHRIAERFEARDGEGGRCRSERRPKAFVCALMRVHRRCDGRIERIGWGEHRPPVIAQGRVKRDRARCQRDREPVQLEKLGEDPEKPSSAMSANSRQRAKRAGISLPQAKATIVAAWNQTQEISAFRRALTEAGYFIIAGDKANVWVVVDGDQNLIGSLDRLLRKKRHEISKLLEVKHDIEPKIQSANAAAHSGSRVTIVWQRVPDNRRVKLSKGDAD
jgi:hypothetical protein